MHSESIAQPNPFNNLMTQELLMALISRWSLGMFPQSWDPNPSHLIPGAKASQLYAPMMWYTEQTKIQ